MIRAKAARVRRILQHARLSLNGWRFEELKQHTARLGTDTGEAIEGLRQQAERRFEELGRQAEKKFEELGQQVRAIEEFRSQTERRFEELRQHEKVVEWRFDDLKKHIVKQRAEMDHVLVQHSAARVASSIPLGPNPLAVATCLPPEETGLATCSALTFRESDIPIDLFAPFNRAEDYFRNLMHPRFRDRNIRIFDLSSLPLALGYTKYRGQLFVIGNSDHNIPIIKSLRDTRYFPRMAPIYVYIHDPCLLNVCRNTVLDEGGRFPEVMASSYGVPSETIDCSFSSLVRNNMFGVRPLIRDVEVSGVIVNSSAAAKMISTELPDTRIHSLFHPALPTRSKTGARRSRGGPSLRIGSFGIPHPEKRTDAVLEAFAQIRKVVPDATLTIAGYHAAKYPIPREILDMGGICIVDAPSDAAFDECLQSADVGVQLRRSSLGESSGPVSRLLELGTPVIVSNIGSFREYGDAVRTVDNDITAEELSKIIIDEAQRSPERLRSIHEYRVTHSPRVFCDLLGDIIPVSDAAGLAL